MSAAVDFSQQDPPYKKSFSGVLTERWVRMFMSLLLETGQRRVDFDFSKTISVEVGAVQVICLNCFGMHNVQGGQFVLVASSSALEQALIEEELPFEKICRLHPWHCWLKGDMAKR